MTPLSAFLFPWVILGFIHPPTFVMSQWTEKMKAVKSLNARMETTLLDSDLPEGSPAVEEEIWIRKPSYFRRTTKFPKGTVHWVMTPAKTVKISDGKAETATPMEVYGAVGLFYLPENPRRMTQMMTQAGIQADQTKWVLKDKRILYQMGSSENPMAFFVKDDWLPAGLSLKSREYRLFVYLPTRFSFPFPDLIEQVEGKKTVESTRVVSVKENPTFADAVFNIETLRASSGSK